MTYLLALVFIVGISGCIGYREDDGYKNSYRSYGNKERKKYSIVGSDYNKGKEAIWRPCELDDYDCIGHFLSLNSECVPVHGVTPDPIHLPVEKFYFPIAKMTITHLDTRVRGFKDAKVTEFYVNKATGNVVIALTIPHYNFTSNAFFTYQRTAKEPIALNDYNTFELDKITLTSVIPKVPILRLEMSDVNADIPLTPPRYYIGPKAYSSHDPAVKLAIGKFEANTVQVVREAFILHSYILMSNFIQKELCDFGLNSFRNYNGYHSFRRSYVVD